MTNRWTEYGDGVFRLQDRRKNDYLLGPTHEELFTLTVKGEYSSYKDFPLLLFQIQTKYRDEARPRAGILRGREFLMKDSYSFDVDDEGLAAVYQRHRDAYQRIFATLGVRYVIVSAVSGAMGGSASEEFLAESEIGEDTFVRCLESGYAANVEAVITAVPESPPIEGQPDAKVYDTPGTPTIATLVDWANTALDREVTAADTLKNVALKMRQPGGDWELLAVGVPGDREVDEKRLAAALDPAEYALLDEADFAKHRFLAKGYIGPKALLANGVRYLVDPRVVDGTAWITGADEPGKHVVGLVAGRDFVADGTIEAAEVRDGDLSPDGAGPLVSARGIEIGHIFQLGRKYTDAFTADVLGEDGKPVRLTMGSYGIGVSRLVAVIAEQHHDELGLRWPSSVSPFDAHVVIANKDERRACRRRRARRSSGPAGHRGAARRPEGITGCEVQGCRVARGAVDRRGGPRLGRWRGRVAQPLHRRDAGDRSRQRGGRHLRGAGVLARPARQLFAAAREGDGDRGDAQHPAPSGRCHRALCQRRHREHPVLLFGRLLEHRTPCDGGVLFHPHREIGRIGRVVDLDRQLIAGGGQRRVDGPRLEDCDGPLTPVPVLGHRGRNQAVDIGRRVRRNQSVAVDRRVLGGDRVEQGAVRGVRRPSRRGGFGRPRGRGGRGGTWASVPVTSLRRLGRDQRDRVGSGARCGDRAEQPCAIAGLLGRQLCGAVG